MTSQAPGLLWLLSATLLAAAGAGAWLAVKWHDRPIDEPPGEGTVSGIGGHPFLRVSPPHSVFIHLAAADADARSGWTARTMCGLPWRATAADADEVRAFLRGSTSAVRPGESVCPLCAVEAMAYAAAHRHQPPTGDTPAHSSR